MSAQELTETLYSEVREGPGIDNPNANSNTLPRVRGSNGMHEKMFYFVTILRICTCNIWWSGKGYYILKAPWQLRSARRTGNRNVLRIKIEDWELNRLRLPNEVALIATSVSQADLVLADFVYVET